jgi:hypothetical protein
VLFALVFAACTGQRQLAGVALNAGEEQVADTIQYELIIMDPGFESWFAAHAKPVWFHSQSYLESWNRQYVMAWNSRVTSPRGNRFFETYIDYQSHIDYGIELNHKLFHYFQYVERRLRIPILPQGIRPQNL